MIEASRPAVRDDLVTVAELAREVRAELTPTRGGAVWAVREARPEPVEAWLERSIEDPTQLLLVATLDGVVVGYAACRIEDLRDGSRLAVIDDLYVTEGARQVSLGETMMNEVLIWATEHRCRGVDALALPGNRAAKNFFETFGLVARAILVHRDLQVIDGDAEEDA